MVAEDFFGAGAEIAEMAEDWSEFRGVFLCNLCNGAKENREANREDALFAAWENAAAKIESGEGGFFYRCAAEIVRHPRDLFIFFRSGGDRFAELCEAEHGGGPVSHGEVCEFWSKRLGLPGCGDSHRMAAVETIQYSTAKRV